MEEGPKVPSEARSAEGAGSGRSAVAPPQINVEIAHFPLVLPPSVGFTSVCL